MGRVAWRLEVDLQAEVPPPPFVVASNHHSFLDPLLIGAAFLHEIRFLALGDLFGRHDWLDSALTVFDVIPVRRGGVPLGPMRAALVHLSQGGVVGLFPEGTRHMQFDPARARPGAAWLASRAGVPLVPVAVTGTERVLGMDNRLRRGRVQVRVGPPLLGAGNHRVEVDRLTRRWGAWVSQTLHSPSPSPP